MSDSTTTVRAGDYVHLLEQRCDDLEAYVCMLIKVLMPLRAFMDAELDSYMSDRPGAQATDKYAVFMRGALNDADLALNKLKEIE